MHFHLWPWQLGPGLTWLLQMILNPTESENSHHDSILHQDTAYILQLVCTHLQHNTGLGCTQLSKSGGWTASGYSSARSIKQCQWLPTREVDPYPQLFIASWSKQLIHQKFISNQSDLGAHQMHPTAPWLQGMSWRQECCNCGRWEQHWAFQEMHNLRSPFTNTVSLLYRL